MTVKDAIVATGQHVVNGGPKISKLSKPDLPWRKTPLIESEALSRAAGCRIFMKLDNLQPSGSFKSRGIGNFIRAKVQSHSGSSSPSLPHFYCTSGGNAGLAAVVAAISLDCAATVVVPTTTSAMMISKLRTAGATDVIQHGESWAEANEYLRGELMANDPTGVYVPAFDDPLIWDGNATLVKELIEQLPQKTGLDATWGNGHRDGRYYEEVRPESVEPDVIVCSVGGGGLFNGIVEGIDEHYHGKKPKILAMETKGCDSLNNSLRAGKNVALPAVTSFATSLAAKLVASRTFELGQREDVVSAVLEDSEAAMGCCMLADDERIMVEPACGVSIAPCYNGLLKKKFPELNKDSIVVVVVCGGSAISSALMEEYRLTYGVKRLGIA